ncbi:MAG: iron ABC transporter permease [Chlorobi bacterium]|nr:iron ABC transporter permease [Chlorobiota bacterium]
MGKHNKTGRYNISVSTVIKWAFVVFVFLPLVYTFFLTFSGGDKLLENVSLMSGNTFFLFLKSTGIALGVATLSTITGTALGFLLYKTKIPFSGFLKLTVLIPLFLSPYILAVAWRDAFFMFFGNTGIISSTLGVILVLTTIYTPLSMLITGNAMAKIDSSIEESGVLLTTYSRMFFRIIIPLIKPALLSSLVLIFIFSISEFSVPAFFGVKVFTTEIFTQFSAFYNHSLAILQSSVLIIICIALLIAERRYLSEAPFFSIGVQGVKTRLYDNRKHHYPLFLFPFIWIIISVVFPFIVLLVQSADGGTYFLTQALKLLSTGFAPSFILAFAGAFIILVISFFAGTERNNRKWFDFILLIPFATPSIIVGISLIKFYNHSALNFIYSSFAIILIGYVAKFTFIAEKLISNSVRQIPASFDEAARVAGISVFSRFRYILIPLILPSIFASYIISFIFIIGELGTTIMVYPPGTEIMPIKAYTIMANSPQQLTSSMSLIILTVTLSLTVLFYMIGKKLMNRFSYR